MLFRGIVLEGVACSGKSTLLRALLEHPRFVGRLGQSVLVLTEHHTQRVLETLGPRSSLNTRSNLDLLEQHMQYLATIAQRLNRMDRWRESNAANPRFTALVERFHFSHVLNYQHLSWNDVADIDSQLAAIGIDLCLVTSSPTTLAARLHSARGERWADFLQEDGQRDRLASTVTQQAVAEYFASQQAALLDLATKSRMRCLRVDTSSRSAQECAQELLDLLV